MARIKPFVALLPDSTWLDQMLVQGMQNPGHLASDPLLAVQSLLEPGQRSGQGLHATKYRESMRALLLSNSYKIADGAAFYLYEQESVRGSQFGIWTLTSLDDLAQGRLLTHEETLPERSGDLKAYRAVVGLEGRPVLLTYERDQAINGLIEAVAGRKPLLDFSYQQFNHRLWSIFDAHTIAELQEAFRRLDRVYVADGHHRLSAAARVHEFRPQWISALYVTAGQLRSREFNRTVLPGLPLGSEVFFEHLHKYGFTTALPENRAFVPETEKRFGVCFQGRWHQYDLKPEFLKQNLPDVSFLQEYILGPLFGIRDPRTDAQLRCWPASEWEQMLAFSKQHEDAVVFSCRALSAQQLMKVADQRLNLPPKSTYMEPKIPYGLLICDHHMTGNRTLKAQPYAINQ